VKIVASLLVAVSLAGCASLRAVDSNVSSFSRWPAGRAPASYVFERLPSQQAQPQQAQSLEDVARRAIEGAGFVAAGEGTTADVSFQIGARATELDRSPFADPFWYGVGPLSRPFVYGRYGRPYWNPGWRYGYGYGPGYEPPYFEREVGVLIRDKASGELLYEARASNEGGSMGASSLLSAMFSAALADFPRGGAVNPHRVRIAPAD